MEPILTNQIESGTELAECMMLNFVESGHPIFRATRALERGELKNKGKGVRSIHFNNRDETIELILRTVISVNQLSIISHDSETEKATFGLLDRKTNLWSKTDG